ncbi:MAG: hypothetical protein ACPLYD_13675 [Anaerolineae bacterium]|jgi:hypothetical protein
MSEFALTLEELALVFSIIGKPEAGQNLMAAQLGEMSEAEARARLLTAGHSLLARGWMVLSDEGPTLNEDLARAAHLLTRADFSIRYSRATPDAEFNLAYHFGKDAILEHRLEQGVVHRLNEIPDAATVIKSGLVFFGLPQAEPFQCPPATLLYSLLNGLKDLDDPAQIDQRLQEAGIAEETRPLLVEDLARPQYRGSALRVQYDARGNLFSEEGFLLLHGPRRLWLITLSGPDRATATLMPATIQAFSQQVTALLHK